jgi:hypothetical protein
MTIRDRGNKTVVPWEFGWNYLKDNKAKNGIHNYDEGKACGDFTGDLLIHDNVVINQAGAGITVISNCGWSQDSYIFNNVLINVGLPSDIQCLVNCGTNGSAITIGSGTGTAYIFNNTIYNWDQGNLAGKGKSSACISVANSPDDISIVVKNNICYSDRRKSFIGNFYRAEAKLDNFTGKNNIWYYPGVSSKEAPLWDSNPVISDPLIDSSFNPVLYLSTELGSTGVSTPIVLQNDIYGVPRTDTFGLGAFEYYVRPAKASSDTAVDKSIL